MIISNKMDSIQYERGILTISYPDVLTIVNYWLDVIGHKDVRTVVLRNLNLNFFNAIFHYYICADKKINTVLHLDGERLHYQRRLQGHRNIYQQHCNSVVLLPGWAEK